MPKIRIGTRGSRLALAQTQTVVEMLSQKVQGLKARVVTVRTAGDRLPAWKRGETDGKGAFTEDIESLLIKKEIDIAVHSLKDLSVEQSETLELGATPPRGDPRDALVSRSGVAFSGLPDGAKIGTSSIRRKAQLRSLRHDLLMVDLHGNVETRLRRLGESRLDGIVLAAAGLDRLAFSARIAERLPVQDVVPAAGQGTIAVQVRRGDRGIKRMVSAINDEKTMLAAECERAFARAIGGDCYVPAGAYAVCKGRSIELTGMMASPDGSAVLKKTAASSSPVELGESLGKELLQLGGAALAGSREIQA